MAAIDFFYDNSKPLRHLISLHLSNCSSNLFLSFNALKSLLVFINCFCVSCCSIRFWVWKPIGFICHSNGILMSRFLILHVLHVFGSLGKGGLGLHRLSLDEDMYWVLLTEHRSKNFYKNEFYNSYLEKNVSNFWMIVKDELVLPLLLDFSYATGLSLPTC
ncbi:hypothetical protein GQ457_02G038960 [Hibiscus cannabinus]